MLTKYIHKSYVKCSISLQCYEGSFCPFYIKFSKTMDNLPFFFVIDFFRRCECILPIIGISSLLLQGLGLFYSQHALPYAPQERCLLPIIDNIWAWRTIWSSSRMHQGKGAQSTSDIPHLPQPCYSLDMPSNHQFDPLTLNSNLKVLETNQELNHGPNFYMPVLVQDPQTCLAFQF